MALNPMSRVHKEEEEAPPSSTTFRTYAGSNGNAVYNAGLGMRIVVEAGTNLVLTHLGAFSAGGAVPGAGVTKTVDVADITAPTTILATVGITSADSAYSDATNNIVLKPITPITLGPGTYAIWSYKSGGTDPIYAYDQPVPGSTPVNNAITGVTQTGGDWFSGSTIMPTGAGGAGVWYGGSTWAGYTIDA